LIEGLRGGVRKWRSKLPGPGLAIARKKRVKDLVRIEKIITRVILKDVANGKWIYYRSYVCKGRGIG